MRKVYAQGLCVRTVPEPGRFMRKDFGSLALA
jgi:hypothetical protein